MKQLKLSAEELEDVASNALREYIMHRLREAGFNLQKAIIIKPPYLYEQKD